MKQVTYFGVRKSTTRNE